MNPKKSFRAFFFILGVVACVFFSCAKKENSPASYPLSVPVVTKGGSGRAKVISPAVLFEKDGKTFARITWSSKNYDYIIAGGKKYLNENPDGNSTFTFPVSSIVNAGKSKTGGIEKSFSLKIIADTLAMGAPHEIEYELFFGDENLESAKSKIGNLESEKNALNKNLSLNFDSKSEKNVSSQNFSLNSDSEIELQADSLDSKNVSENSKNVFQPDFLSFEKCGSLNLLYAKEFSVDFYEYKNDESEIGSKSLRNDAEISKNGKTFESVSSKESENEIFFEFGHGSGTEIGKTGESSGNEISKNIESFKKIGSAGKAANSGDIYCLVKIQNGGNFLLAPENAPKEIENLKNLPENTFVLKKPLDKVYLVSTSAMDFVARLGAVENLRFSGTKESGWFISEAKDAMKSGKILYAGKYSAPDYELLLSRGCNLALENTMIFHNPEVKEKLEELGIPVVVERSVYEKNPLARLEWIKFYGILFGKLAKSEKYFEIETEKISQVINQKKNQNSGKKVAFFFVSSNGSVNVRSGGDYISKMIEMSGGKYVPAFEQKTLAGARSTVNMQFESFFAAASDADILIYDRSIDKNLRTLSQLKKKNPLFPDFAAVKIGEVYCTKDDFFQKTTGTADFISDLGKILGESRSAENLVFLEKMR